MLSRHGLAPVVSVIILVFIVLVAGGGTYAWIGSIVAAEQAEVDRSLHTRLAVRDVVCDRGAVRVGVSNTGSLGIDTARVDLYVYDVSSNDLVASRDDVGFSDVSLEPGAFVSFPVFMSSILRTGNTYRVELSFPDSDTATTGTCTVDVGSLAAGVWTFDNEPAHLPVVLYDDTPQLYYVKNFENGTFGPLQSFGSGFSRENDGGVAMADFTQNGVYDIMFYGSNHDVYLWTDVGDGPPSGSPEKVASLGGSKAQGFSPGDWNNDGYIDVIEIQDGDYIKNFGNGTWSTSSLGFSGHRDVVGADFDQDGCEDLVYDINSSWGVGFRAGNCDGTFGGVNTVVGQTEAPDDNYLAEGDFDSDGNMDVVLVDRGDDGEADLYTGDGSGGFTLSNENFTNWGNDHKNPVAADLDRDGDEDLIFCEHDSNNLWYVEGFGNGTFKAARNIADTPTSCLGSSAPSNDFALDTSGGENHGKRIGPPNWTAGETGGALDFDGRDDYVSTSFNGSGLHTYTIAAWVQWDQASSSGANLGNAVVESVSPRFDYSIHADSTNIRTYAHPMDPGDIGSLAYATDPTAKRYHVVSWRDHGDFRLYVDGVLQGTDTVTDNPINATAMNVGKNPGFSGDPFNGTVDEVQVYTTALR